MIRSKLADPIEDTEPVASPGGDETTTDTPRTDLGRRLFALRTEIVRSGTPLLGWDDLERELAERRGGTGLREDEDRDGP